jgi:hypothetical protein
MKFEDDYYGEKIEDLSDYRRWLRNMNRKRRELQRSLLSENELKKKINKFL